MFEIADSAHLSDEEVVRLNKQLAKISARIVRAANETLDDEIIKSIQEFIQPLGLDRGGLLQVEEGSPIITVSHAWYEQGVEQVSNEINLAELFPWTYQQVVVEGRTMVMARHTDLPPEAETDRQSHVMLGTLSSLAIPLFIGSRVHHLMTANAQAAERLWPEEVISNLRLLGEIFVSALQRRDSERELCQARDRLDLAAASANAGLWELDFTSGQLWATPKARQLFGFAPKEEITLDVFMEKVHVEDRTLITSVLDTLSDDQKLLNVEYRTPGGDDTLRWMHSRGRLSETDHPGHPLLTGVTLDITNLKRMEGQLKEQLLEIERLHDQLEKENVYLRKEATTIYNSHAISAASNSMQMILTQIDQVARTDSTVLVEGETGTGKELVAQAIHRQSDRGKRVMIKVNCAALPASLMESELFGREKGAFTGALSQQAGRFELADKSTLFLDEVAELPQEAQSKLLRVLQEGEFERLGSSRTIKVDVRVIAATNRDLLKEVEEGRFRRDLYYRLAVFPVKVPPLRERTEDIQHLVWEFVAEFSERMGKRIRQVTSYDMERLKAYLWPGNVRELRNIIERAMIVSKGEVLEVQPLIPASCQPASIATLEDAERQHIQKALKVAAGKVKGPGGAAELLEMNPSTLTSRMLKLGIRPTLS